MAIHTAYSVRMNRAYPARTRSSGLLPVSERKTPRRPDAEPPSTGPLPALALLPPFGQDLASPAPDGRLGAGQPTEGKANAKPQRPALSERARAVAGLTPASRSARGGAFPTGIPARPEPSARPGEAVSRERRR